MKNILRWFKTWWEKGKYKAKSYLLREITCMKKGKFVTSLSISAVLVLVFTLTLSSLAIFGASGDDMVVNKIRYTRYYENGSDGKNHGYIQFGSYPQTKVTDASIISGLDSTSEGDIDPSTGEINYKNKKYVKLDSDYYEVEPILWQISGFNTSDQSINLFSESCLDSRTFDVAANYFTWAPTNYRSITWFDNSPNANEAKNLPMLRLWLNNYNLTGEHVTSYNQGFGNYHAETNLIITPSPDGTTFEDRGFYEKAFSGVEYSLMKKINMYNYSGYYNQNLDGIYVSKTDYVSMYNDILLKKAPFNTTATTSDTNRYGYATDYSYAKATISSRSTTQTNGRYTLDWWEISRDTSSGYYPYYVSKDGKSSNIASNNNTKNGVRPCISLNTNAITKLLGTGTKDDPYRLPEGYELPQYYEFTNWSKGDHGFIEFGSFPQTKVSSDLASIITLRGETNLKTGKVECDTDNDGVKEEYVFEEGDYYKVEPILWDMLDVDLSSRKITLAADNVLEARPYSGNSTVFEYWDGSRINPNNNTWVYLDYYPLIRLYLNSYDLKTLSSGSSNETARKYDITNPSYSEKAYSNLTYKKASLGTSFRDIGFYEKAFTSDEKDFIYAGINKFWSGYAGYHWDGNGYTLDPVRLLTYYDIDNDLNDGGADDFGFSNDNSLKIGRPTDYSSLHSETDSISNAYTQSSDVYAQKYWLMSAPNETKSFMIDTDFDRDSYDVKKNLGVRPVIVLDIDALPVLSGNGSRVNPYKLPENYNAPKEKEYTTYFEKGDDGINHGYIEFGRFPQSQVGQYTDPVTYEAIKDLEPDSKTGIITWMHDGITEEFVKYNTKFYRIEPIKWQILDTSNSDNLYLLSDKVLEGRGYDNTSTERKWNSNPWLRVYLNNYNLLSGATDFTSLNSVSTNGIYQEIESSDYRARGFLEKAFSFIERQLLVKEETRNNKISTEDGSSTADYVRILTATEAAYNQYGFSSTTSLSDNKDIFNSNRLGYSTDYCFDTMSSNSSTPYYSLQYDGRTVDYWIKGMYSRTYHYYIKSDSNIYNSSTQYLTASLNLGVRPMITLNRKMLDDFEGSGSYDNPYRLPDNYEWPTIYQMTKWFELGEGGVTHSYVKYGSFPQSEVTSSDPNYSSLINGELDSYLNKNTGKIEYNGKEYVREKDKNGEYKYYVVEPILWKVLNINRDTGEVTLWSDKILESRFYDSQDYQNSYWDGSAEIPLLRAYLNNYKLGNKNETSAFVTNYSMQDLSNDPRTRTNYSYKKAPLNASFRDKGFIEKTFTDKERKFLIPGAVFNSYTSYDGNNIAKQRDKVRLLTSYEMISYTNTPLGFTKDAATADPNRIGTITAYGASQYYDSVSEGDFAYYYLASRKANTKVMGIKTDGVEDTTGFEIKNKAGVRPVITVDFLSLGVFEGDGTLENPYHSPSSLNMPESQELTKYFEKGTDNHTHGYVNFGSFPQNEVNQYRESELYNILKNLTEDPNTGKIYYDENGDGKDEEFVKYTSSNYFRVEPITWNIIDIDDEKDEVTLLSSNVIDAMIYDTTNQKSLWGGASNGRFPKIRIYLNSYDWGGYTFDQSNTTSTSNLNYTTSPKGTTFINRGFFEKAFNDDEKRTIIETTSKLTDDKYLGTNSSTDKDKVRLLTGLEATYEGYGFNSTSTTTLYESGRLGPFTDFVIRKSNITVNSSVNPPAFNYWLKDRSNENYSYYVNYDGNASATAQVQNNSYGIRPVITIPKSAISKAYGDGTIDNPYSLDPNYIPPSEWDGIDTWYKKDYDGNSHGYVEYGHFPQKEIKDTDLISNIDKAENYDINTDLYEYDGKKYVKESKDGTNYKYYEVEPIKWRVLEVDKENNKVLLLSDKVLEARDHTSQDNYSILWDGSYNGLDLYYPLIRLYLNNYKLTEENTLNNYQVTSYTDINTSQDPVPTSDLTYAYTQSGVNKPFYERGFLEKAFTQEERTNLTKSKFRNYSTSYDGNYAQNVSDYVRLLSKDEALNVNFGFSSDYSAVKEASGRLAFTTDYAMLRNYDTGTTSDGKKLVPWYTSSISSKSVFTVKQDGAGWAYNGIGDKHGVRPVIELKLDNFEMIGDGSENNPFTTYLPEYNVEVNVDTDDEDKGTVVGGGKTSKAHIEARPNIGYIFDGWYTEDGEKYSSSPTLDFMPSNDLKLTAKFNEIQNTKYIGDLVNHINAGVVCATINYGSFPKTDVTSTMSSKLSGLDANPKTGKIEYGGKEYVFENGKYYLVEPITWRILKIDDDGEGNNKITAISENVLESRTWDSQDSKQIFWDGSIKNGEADGSYPLLRLYLNNYDLSGGVTNYSVCDTTNDPIAKSNLLYTESPKGTEFYDRGFIEKAFSSEEKGRLVGGSPETIYPSDESENTIYINDKVRLLSYYELYTNSQGFKVFDSNMFGFNPTFGITGLESRRYAYSTDYAKSKYSSTLGNLNGETMSYWRLARSSGQWAKAVDQTGNLNTSYTIQSYEGVLPVISFMADDLSNINIEGKELTYYNFDHWNVDGTRDTTNTESVYGDSVDVETLKKITAVFVSESNITINSIDYTPWHIGGSDEVIKGYINLGYYPKTKITDSSLIDKLDLLPTRFDNTVIYNGEKYYKFENGLIDNWFKFEPITWQILDIGSLTHKANLLSESIIESRIFDSQNQTKLLWNGTGGSENEYPILRLYLNNYKITNKGDIPSYSTISEDSLAAKSDLTYENAKIGTTFYDRGFLEKAFSKTASDTILSDVPVQFLADEDGSSYSDKVRLLTKSELYGSSTYIQVALKYGFSSDNYKLAPDNDFSLRRGLVTGRLGYATDYASINDYFHEYVTDDYVGASEGSRPSSVWRTSSRYSDMKEIVVYPDGGIADIIGVMGEIGIRPSISVDLNAYTTLIGDGNGSLDKPYSYESKLTIDTNELTGKDIKMQSPGTDKEVEIDIIPGNTIKGIYKDNTKANKLSEDLSPSKFTMPNADYSIYVDVNVTEKGALYVVNYLDKEIIEAMLKNDDYLNVINQGDGDDITEISSYQDAKISSIADALIEEREKRPIASLDDVKVVLGDNLAPTTFTVEIDGEEVEFNTDDKIYKWDVSEVAGTNKIVAFYFRGVGAVSGTDYGDDGIVVLRDMKPSSDPDNPNRLMQFDSYYWKDWTLELNGSNHNYVYMINEDKSRMITGTNYYLDYASYRTNNPYRTFEEPWNTEYVASPWSIMNADGQLNKKEELLVKKFVVAGPVHSGKDIRFTFAGLDECEYMDLTNLIIDYDYINDNYEFGASNQTFSCLKDCVIKMPKKTGYLAQSFKDFKNTNPYSMKNITLDFTGCEIDLVNSNLYSSANEGMNYGSYNINKIILPDSLVWGDYKYLQPYLNNTKTEDSLFYYEVFNDSNESLGFTTELLDINSTKYQGAKYIVRNWSIPIYLGYNIYVNAESEYNKNAAVQSFINGLKDPFGNIAKNTIKDESFNGKFSAKELIDNLNQYLQPDGDIDLINFLLNAYEYMEEKLDDKFNSSGSLFTDTLGIDLTDSNNPYKVAYDALNEYIFNVLNEEVQVEDDDETYNYLDEVVVTIKDLVSNLFTKGFKLFQAENTYEDVTYTDMSEIYQDYEHLDPLGNFNIDQSGNSVKFTCTIDDSSVYDDNISGYAAVGGYVDKEIEGQAKITLSGTPNDVFALSYYTYLDGVTYLTKDDFNNGVCNLDLLSCDDAIVFILEDKSNFSNSGITNIEIEITLPKKISIKGNKNFEVGEIEDEFLVDNDNYKDSYTVLKKLTNYYVLRVGKKNTQSILSWTNSDKATIYYGNTGFTTVKMTSTPVVDKTFDDHALTTITDYSQITDDNVEELISSGEFKKAEIDTFIMSPLPEKIAYIVGVTDVENNIVLVPTSNLCYTTKFDSTFTPILKSTGEFAFGALYKAFGNNFENGISYSNSIMVNPFSLERPDDEDDDLISIKATDEAKEFTDTLGLSVSDADHEFDEIKLYKTNNLGHQIEIPSDAFTVSYTGCDGIRGAKGKLTVTGDGVRVTGTRDYAVNLYQIDSDGNGIDDAFENKMIFEKDGKEYWTGDAQYAIDISSDGSYGVVAYYFNGGDYDGEVVIYSANENAKVAAFDSYAALSSNIIQLYKADTTTLTIDNFNLSDFVGTNMLPTRNFLSYTSGTKTFNVTPWSLLYVNDELGGDTPVNNIYLANEITLTSGESFFGGLRSLTSFDLTNLRLDGAEDASIPLSRMFISCNSLQSITFDENFDTSKVTNMSQMFFNCNNIEEINLEHFDTSKVSDMSQMFYNCNKLETLDISSFNTENVEDMNMMFNGCSSLTELNLSHFNTTKVENIINMFGECSKLKTLDISNFDTSAVISAGCNFNQMFKNCSSLESLELPSTFEVHDVWDASSMFEGCSSLTSLTLSEGFTLSNVNNISNLFKDCSSLERLDLSKVNITAGQYFVSNVFAGCTSLNYIKLPATMTTAGTINLPEGVDWYIFDQTGSTNLVTTNKLIPASSSASYVSTDVSIYTTSSGISYSPEDLVVYDDDKTSGQKARWNISEDGTGDLWANVFYKRENNEDEVDTDADYILVFTGSEKDSILNFSYAYSRKISSTYMYFISSSSGSEFSQTIAKSNWRTYKVTPWSYLVDNEKIKEAVISEECNPKSFNLLFAGMPNLSNINIETNGTLKNPGSMNATFAYSGITSFDFKTIDTTDLAGCAGLFSGCKKLVSVDFDTIDISNCTSLNYMFSKCTLLKTFENINQLDTSNVKTFSYMFSECDAIESLNLSWINTIKATTTNSMFNQCGMLKSITFPDTFTTDNVTNMNNMFRNCDKLTNITFEGDPDTSSVRDMANMFYGCGSLVDFSFLSKFETGEVRNMDSMFYMCKKVKTLTLPETFDTSNVCNMNSMFSWCSELETINLPSTFVCTNVGNGKINGNGLSSEGNMNAMFYLDYKLKNLDLSHFTTNNCKGFHWMFRNCSVLENLDISNLETNFGTDFENMFKDSPKLLKVDLGNFTINEGANVTDFFANNTSLKEITLPKVLDDSITINLPAHLDTTKKWYAYTNDNISDFENQTVLLEKVPSGITFLSRDTLVGISESMFLPFITKEYDGQTTSTKQIDVSIGDETVKVNLTIEFESAGIGENLNVTITPSFADPDDNDLYSLPSPYSSTNGKITPKELTFNVTLDPKEYDGTNVLDDSQIHISDLTGVVGSDTVTVSISGSYDNAQVSNSKVVTLNATLSGTSAGNYVIKDELKNITKTDGVISKKHLGYDLTITNKVFDDNADMKSHVSATPKASDIVGSENVSINVVDAYFTDGYSFGDHSLYIKLELAGTDKGNYYIVEEPTGKSAKVTKDQVKVTFKVTGDKVYDGSSSANLVVAVDQVLPAGIEVEFDAKFVDSDGANDKNVGEGKKIVVTPIFKNAIDANNYDFEVDTYELTGNVKQKLLNYTPVATNRKYNGEKGVTVTANNLEGVETGDNPQVTLTGEMATKDAGDVKTVNASASVNDPNYKVENTTCEVKISPKALHIDATGEDIEYGSGDTVNVTFTARSTDILSGDVVDITSSQKRGTGTVSYTQAKNGLLVENVTWPTSLTGADKDNYEIQTTECKVNVTQLDLTGKGLEVTLTYNSDYDGRPKDIHATVKITSDGTFLTEGRDFTITWDNNVDIGTHTATISFIGDYKGSVTKPFEIKGHLDPVTLKQGETENVYLGEYVHFVTKDDTCKLYISRDNKATWTELLANAYQVNYDEDVFVYQTKLYYNDSEPAEFKLHVIKVDDIVQKIANEMNDSDGKTKKKQDIKNILDDDRNVDLLFDKDDSSPNGDAYYNSKLKDDDYLNKVVDYLSDNTASGSNADELKDNIKNLIKEAIDLKDFEEEVKTSVNYEEEMIKYERLSEGLKKIFDTNVLNNLKTHYYELINSLGHETTDKEIEDMPVEIFGAAEHLDTSNPDVYAQTDNIRLLVERITDLSRINNLQSLLNNQSIEEQIIVPLDIKLINKNADREGQLVQPKDGESILVRLRLPENYYGKIVNLYGVNSGALETITNRFMQKLDGYCLVYFDATHFSDYFLTANSPQDVSVTSKLSGDLTLGSISPEGQKLLSKGSNYSLSITSRDKSKANKATINVLKYDDATKSFIADTANSIVLNLNNKTSFNLNAQTHYFIEVELDYDESFKEEPKPSGGGGGGSAGGVTYTVLPKDEIIEMHLAFMKGYEDKTFRPQEAISREEVATIVARCDSEFNEDFNFTSHNTFPDVDTRWSKNYIGFCKLKDLIHGYEDGTFGPTRYMTRAELATLVNNFLRVQNASFDNVDLTKPAFSDIDGRWYEESVNKLAALGILNGYEDGTFRGDNFVTRIEVTIVMNKINKRTAFDEIPDEYVEKITKVFKDVTPSRWFFKDVAESVIDHPADLY